MRPLEHEIRRFIVDAFLYGQDARAPRPHDSLLASRTVDTAGVLEIVAHLRDRYGVAIEPGDIVPANLDSIDRIVRFLEERRTRTESPPGG